MKARGLERSYADLTTLVSATPQGVRPLLGAAEVITP